MFYALVKGKIPCDDFVIEHVIEDIESLNNRAFHSELEVTALSCHAFALVTDRYDLLAYGASVGENYGPIVVAPRKGTIRGSRIAVPGRYTTAFLALQIFEPDFIPVFTPFDQIFSVLEKDKADFGLLIHEGQLTYREKGFEKIVDLGEWWFEEFNLPLPLGINAIRKDLDPDIKKRFAKLFLESIEFAMSHREEALRYALEFGRGIDAKRGNRFIGMYVNDYSLALGDKGIHALRTLFQEAWQKKLFPAPVRFEVVHAPQSKKSPLKEVA